MLDQAFTNVKIFNNQSVIIST